MNTISRPESKGLSVRPDPMGRSRGGRLFFLGRRHVYIAGRFATPQNQLIPGDFDFAVTGRIIQLKAALMGVENSRRILKLDRTLVNLNNGFTCPTPRVALESEWRYMDMINMLPVHYQGMIARNVETIRLRMAAEFGCEPEELALTRGAREALQIAQNGIDLGELI